MILAVGGIKGGSGKTTVATNLAIMRAGAGKDVLLIDADPQQTATDFTALRSESLNDPGYTCTQLQGASLRGQLLRLKPKYHDILVDLGGRDTLAQRITVGLADMLLVPFAPRSFDIWTLEAVVAMVEEIRPANPDVVLRVFVNSAYARGTDNDDAEALMRERVQGGELMPQRIGNRKAFSNAAAAGLAVTELRPPDPKAVAEIQSIYDAVFA